MSPEDEAELELLRRDVEALGGDPNAVLARAQNTPYVSRAPFYNDGQGVMADQERGLGAGSSVQSRRPIQSGGGQGAQSFRDVGTYRYEYLDPNAPGAAPGAQQGPMSDELKHLGVVKPGPQGYDMVDTAALGFKNASATGELAREVEALRSEIASLGGNPDAVLSRVNKPAPKPRQGRTVADVDFGDITTENAAPDRTTLEGAGQYDQDVLREEARQRQFYNDVSFPYQQYVDMGRAEPIQRQAPRPPAGAVDFDQRQEDELRAMGGFGTTDAERQNQIRQEIETYHMGGPGKYRPDPRMAGQLAREINVDPETGRTIGNVSEEEVRRALQRREELFL